MSEIVITYQQFKYDEKYPFYIGNIDGYITEIRDPDIFLHTGTMRWSLLILCAVLQHTISMGKSLEAVLTG